MTLEIAILKTEEGEHWIYRCPGCDCFVEKHDFIKKMKCCKFCKDELRPAKKKKSKS